MLKLINKPAYDPTSIPLKNPSGIRLSLEESIATAASWLGKDTFQFLNQKKHFEHGIDWNYNDFGKLWTYNLNYFEFLSQAGISKPEGLFLIRDFLEKEALIKDGMEPFPVSLRIIFWIKFLSKHEITEAQIDQSLFRQIQYLSANPEYHLLGNHLLENGFGLLFGACYFDNPQWLEQAKKILFDQVPEQILSDGGHFELSPMYHQLMLFRILDAINLLQQNPNASHSGLLELLREKAAVMLGWLDQMTFSNGDAAQVNDSAPGIAPNRNSLFAYASRLKIKMNIIPLRKSGYRKYSKGDYELLADVGNIGPDYIPGHAHSDTFNFVLYYKGHPLIVDTGISTYEKNTRRNLERSTEAHNTVMVDGKEQSEVWGGFRVARRAKVFDLTESPDHLQASHDGYRRINVVHQRSFDFEEQVITINDQLSHDKTAKAFLHFHPAVKPELVGQEIHGEFGKIQFDKHTDIFLAPYLYANGFNQTIKATKAVITFSLNLPTKITLS